MFHFGKEITKKKKKTRVALSLGEVHEKEIPKMYYARLGSLSQFVFYRQDLKDRILRACFICTYPAYNMDRNLTSKRGILRNIVVRI